MREKYDALMKAREAHEAWIRDAVKVGTITDQAQGLVLAKRAADAHAAFMAAWEPY